MIFKHSSRKFTKSIFKFIENSEVLINDNHFEELYRIANLENIDIRELTQLLYEGGLNPLEHMSYVPENFIYSTPELIEVIIPEGVEEIHESAFYDCINIKSVTLPSTVHKIMDWALADCDSLKEITIEGKLDSLAPLGIYQLPSLEKVYSIADNADILLDKVSELKPHTSGLVQARLMSV